MVEGDACGNMIGGKGAGQCGEDQGCEGAREIEVELWRGEKQMKTLTANNCGSDDTYYDLYIAVTQPLIDEFDPAQLNPNVEPGETQPRTTMSREVSGPPRP